MWIEYSKDKKLETRTIFTFLESEEDDQGLAEWNILDECVRNAF